MSEKTKDFWNTRKLVTNAALIALHIVLSQVATIRIGNSMVITVSGITEVVAGLLFGPISGGLVGLMGSLGNQMLLYGFTATTALWIIPAGLRGMICGWYARSRGYQPGALGTLWVLVVTAAIVTAVNTNVMIIDATVYGYNTDAAVLTQLGMRYLSGALTSVAYTAVAAPLMRRLGRVEGLAALRE